MHGILLYLIVPVGKSISDFSSELRAEYRQTYGGVPRAAIELLHEDAGRAVVNGAVAEVFYHGRATFFIVSPSVNEIVRVLAAVDNLIVGKNFGRAPQNMWVWSLERQPDLGAPVQAPADECFQESEPKKYPLRAELEAVDLANVYRELSTDEELFQWARLACSEEELARVTGAINLFVYETSGGISE